MMVFKFNPNRSDKMKTKKELSKKAFADQAIHTSCDAFFREDFFAYRKGEAGQEYYPELSCGKDLPICSFSDDEDDLTIQGVFHHLTNSASDLWLVCSHFADIGEEYYVFFQADWDGNTDQEWVVWTPNSEHYNK
jgi:hypothetical protein